MLNQVSFQLRPGERVIVLGPSGSGKSSLLKTISGVIPHSTNLDLCGQVKVAGIATENTSVVERARIVGVLAQDPAASVCLATVEDEIALPLENLAVEPADISGRIDEVLRLVSGSALRHRGTLELSGGETQRVALAATLAMRPRVLLLDEPTSMLDPAGIQAVRTAIEDATSQQRPTVILVEHRLDEYAGVAGAAGLPERALVLDESGTLIADGPTQQVMAEHADDLHAAGCWLPLDAELQALSGHYGGLANPLITDWLGRLAADRSSDGEEPAPAAPILRARNLQIGREHNVLAGFDLDLFPGEVVALLGPNGIGKTSLLLTLAGLLPARAGTVSGPRPAMVFQNPEWQFLAHRVRDEVGVGLPADHAAIDQALRTHRLEHVAEQSPFRCSGGEQRRLSLAAMLAHHERPVLLADEPTFGLDRRDAMAAARTLRDAARNGRAVLCSTHDIRFAATIADRVIVLGPGAGPVGELVAHGKTLEVLADPHVRSAGNIILPELVRFLIDEFGTGPGPVAVLRALAGWSRVSAAQDAS